MFYLIAATGRNRELGSKGGLVWHLPGDLKYFKEVTVGYPVFMGYNTFKSLPKMLPGRKHYVLSYNKDLPTLPEAMNRRPVVTGDDSILLPRRQREPQARVGQAPVVVTDLDEFIAKHENSPEVVFVIGGASVYKQMLPHCKKLFLTEIDAESDAADVFFPEFDKSLYTRKVVGKGEDNGINYEFVEYTKNN